MICWQTWNRRWRNRGAAKRRERGNMKYDFDEVVDRRDTNSLKYDFALERGRRSDVIPMWVADMDFRTAPEILEQLHRTVDHGIFGYSEGKESYFQALQDWFYNRFGWQIKNEWLVKTPGVVFAIAAAVRGLTQEGDAVMLQQPVYYPFSEVIRDNNRRPVCSPLKLREGHYEIDFEDLEEKISSEHVKLFLLCSPHNPVGRVWKEWELRRLGEICLRYGVLVVSDEIHSDFTYEGYTHHVFADIAPEFAAITVTCTAPSKTFNLAGLQISNIFISDPALRKRFQKAVDAAGYSQPNLMGLAACEAAYKKGGPWLAALKVYLAENLAFVRSYLREHIPEIRLVEPEGTYLIWLDFRGLGLTRGERKELVADRARLWLDNGAMFGAGGEGFERMNIACPRETLRRAMEQLEKGWRGMKKSF